VILSGEVSWGGVYMDPERSRHDVIEEWARLRQRIQQIKAGDRAGIPTTDELETARIERRAKRQDRLKSRKSGVAE
jgi:hypothetical protein